MRFNLYQYDLGESAPTDVECAMWEILAPSDLTADGLDGYVHLEWTDPPDGGSPGIGDECLFFDLKNGPKYPPIKEQLDYIYHNGLTKWKADMITPVKEKYPK